MVHQEWKCAVIFGIGVGDTRPGADGTRTTMSKIERPKSLTEIATDRLRDDIISGRIGLGEALSEGTLAETLGISRTPIREALMRLQTEGLVSVVPQTGTFVFTVDAKQLRDICDVRVALETMALRLALERDPAGLAGALTDVVAAMTDARAADDPAGYLRLDSRFHLTLFAHCDNAYLSDANQVIAARMAALRNRLGTDPAHMKKSFEEHKAIAKAVKRGNADKAIAVLEGHIGRKEGSYWQTDRAAEPRRAAAG